MIAECDMPLADMRRTAQTHRCGECGGALVVAWGGALGINSYVLRCQNTSHKTITSHDPAYDRAVRIAKEVRGLDSTALMKMPENKMLERINFAKFPQDLTDKEKRTLANVAITYGFDPLMGEVSIFQGRPFVSIDGRYRKAQESGKLDGVETRPATKEERLDWGIPDGDFFFRAEVYVKGSSRPFVAWGRVYKSETEVNKPGDAYKPVVKNPQRIAEKRAEAQALRKGFHIPLPSVEDIGSPEAADLPVVDSGAGGIIEGTATVLPGGNGNGNHELPPSAEELMAGIEQASSDVKYITDGMDTIKWNSKVFVSWLKSKANFAGLNCEGTREEILGRMTPDQLKFVRAEVDLRAAMR